MPIEAKKLSYWYGADTEQLISDYPVLVEYAIGEVRIVFKPRTNYVTLLPVLQRPIGSPQSGEFVPYVSVHTITDNPDEESFYGTFYQNGRFASYLYDGTPKQIAAITEARDKLLGNLQPCQQEIERTPGDYDPIFSSRVLSSIAILQSFHPPQQTDR